MIKRVQLEQQSGSGLLLKKTHKGEVEIEDDFTNIIDVRDFYFLKILFILSDLK